ncbi:MAG: alpha/beta hydrolase, partial [Nitrospira sp.]|nr:alpha/beta hydrolase [Nitrospira sp.]
MESEDQGTQNEQGMILAVSGEPRELSLRYRPVSPLTGIFGCPKMRPTMSVALRSHGFVDKGRFSVRMGHAAEPATLVLLPGLDGTDVFFRPLLATLPVWIKPTVVQFPTVGANDYPDLLRFVRLTLAERLSYYVLGWSFAGPLALMLAAAEPNRVRGVILASTF